MVKELSTLDGSRPTILHEKRRIEKELGLALEPSIVFPRSNDPKAKYDGVWRRIALWLRGSTP